MSRIAPTSPQHLAQALKQASQQNQTIHLEGNGSKSRMGGPISSADVSISTAALDRLLQYEPNDLTISVEAGMPWARLQEILRANRQMIPLDPPCYDQATVGGVLAANTSGPRRRLYGSVRDVVIGMKFATLEGKLIQSGGMVVKNVAGLDMGKLMIGSFGTLAAIAVVNFKLFPIPPASRTFIFSFRDLAPAIEKRDRILASVLQPAAIDLLSPGSLGRTGWTLAIQAGGSERVIERYAREMIGAEVLVEDGEPMFWAAVREFPAAASVVVRISVALQDLGEVLGSLPLPAVARGGNGIAYASFSSLNEAAEWMKTHPWPAVIEWRSESVFATDRQWPTQGTNFPVMQRVKSMLDPTHLLNRGRLYGRI